MPIELIDKIKPKNGQGFPLVDAEDVVMPDGTRLSVFSPQIQTDYTQNDSTAKDYIKNRPFYEGEPILTEFPLRETLLEQQTLNDFVWNEEFVAYAKAARATFNFIDGETYTVVWDDQAYKVVAQDTSALISNTVSVGNGSAFGLTGNNEPFAIIGSDGYIIVISLTDTEATPHDVAIYKEPVFIYNEGEVAFAASGTPSSEMLALWQSDWKSCVFTWDGVEYVCEPKMLSGVIKCIGNTEKMTGTGDSGEPFIMMCADASVTSIDLWAIYDLETEITDTTEVGSTTTHEVGLVINTPNITKLDPKYLENIDYETQVINKPFGTIPSGTVLFDGTIVCSETGEGYSDYIKLVEGVTYIVEIDGTALAVAATSPEEGTILLTLSTSPYIALASVGGVTMLIYSEGEHTVKITLAEDVVKKIDEIYLPESTGGSGLPEVTTDDNDKIIQVVDGAYQVVTLENSVVKTYIDNYIDEALGGEY